MTSTSVLFLVVFIVAIFLSTNILADEEIRDPSQIIKQDLKYIKCEVCEHAVAELVEEINSIKEEHQKLIKN